MDTFQKNKNILVDLYLLADIEELSEIKILCEKAPRCV